MTDREKAIIMARTGICMLAGEKLNVFYQYLEELFGRPIYTHEIVILQSEIEKRSNADFIKICRDEQPERVRGKWIPQGWNDTYCKCSRCDAVYVSAEIPYNYCPNCGADMRGTR